MTERVDVLAYDAYEERSESEQKRRQTIALATYTGVAVVLGAGLVQGRLLLSVLAAIAILASRWLLFGEDRAVRTRYRAVEAGRAEEIRQAHGVEARKRDQLRNVLAVLVTGAILSYGFISGSLLLSVLGASTVATLQYVTWSAPELPRIVEEDVERDQAERQFDLVDVDDEDD
jgi:uncharacterized membrane protein